MSTAQLILNAGGLVPVKAKVDKGSSEEVVARTYQHPALGDRPLVRISSARLGQAEDLAMEFLGFEAPQISKPIAIEQRRSLGFAAWALTNDPDNAQYALDLVKRMKSADRKAKSKPGHAWDIYDELSKELGRSVRHFLPPFWEEVGRAYKELGNQTYAGRALNRSLEAERVHALPSDRSRRRDVILEFVLAGCLAGKALSDYTDDLKNQYPPQEAYDIFRDLCVRRTRGGMAPWASLPKDFLKLAKAADLDADAELESWLEEVIESPAMDRAAMQFWKGCDHYCRRIVQRNSAFAVALLRYTQSKVQLYEESKLWDWLDLLEAWGVFEFLWEDEHLGAPPLGEPIADWFGRISRHELPIPKRVFWMLERLTPRLKKEGAPLPLSTGIRWNTKPADIDLIETCLDLGIEVQPLPKEAAVDFNGWLMEQPDHKYRNRDLLLAPADERFADAIKRGLANALTCKGKSHSRGYQRTDWERRSFPEAAGEREGILRLWREHALEVVGQLENTGLASFSEAFALLQETFWPETLRYFPEVAEKLAAIEPNTSLQLTLQSGIVDEYGWAEFDQLVEESEISVGASVYSIKNCALLFPQVVVWNKTHAFVLDRSGKISKRELRLPPKIELQRVVPVGSDLAVYYRDKEWNNHFYWLSDPTNHHPASYKFLDADGMRETILEDGGLFYGKQAIHPGDSQQPQCARSYFHDGERFWGTEWEYDDNLESRTLMKEIDPHTGKLGRASVPSWLESADGDTIDFDSSYLFPVPEQAKDSPLGCKNGMVGWKVFKRRDGTYVGEGIDGRRWENPLGDLLLKDAVPLGMLRRIGADGYLLLAQTHGRGKGVFDTERRTAVALWEGHRSAFTCGQEIVLPLEYWHLLKPRHEATSKKLRKISLQDCALLVDTADQARQGETSAKPSEQSPVLPAAAIQVLRSFVRDDVKEKIETSPSTAKVFEKVQNLFPKIPDRFACGIAGVVQFAASCRTDFLETRKRLVNEAQNKSVSTVVNYTKVDEAVQTWKLPCAFANDFTISLAQHLKSVTVFLQEEQPAGPLPRAKNMWFSLLNNLPWKVWQTYWRAQAGRCSLKADREPPWRELLKFIRELGIAQLPGRFDLLIAQKTNTNGKSNNDREPTGTSYGLVSGEDRFVVIVINSFRKIEYQILRYSTAKIPKTPPGFVIKSEQQLFPQADSENFEAFFKAIDAAEKMPIPTKKELVELAAELGASPAEVGLIWIAGLNFDGYEANFLPSEIRNALGIKMTDAKAARQSLTNLSENVRQALFHSVVASGLAAPFAEDKTAVFAAIRQAWDQHMPKRIPLDAEYQKLLSSLARQNKWGCIDHEHILAAATDPKQHGLLQVKAYKIKYTRNHELRIKGQLNADPVTAAALQTLAQLVAMVHCDTPIGHEARKSVPALVEQLIKVIKDENLLWELCSKYFYSKDKKELSVAWINQHLGKSNIGKDKIARFDDGLLVAAAHQDSPALLIGYRVGKVRSADEVKRLQWLVSLDEDPFGGQRNHLPLIALLQGSGFCKLRDAILGNGLHPGAWPQNPLHLAPEIVPAIAKKWKLSEDGAVLYLQTLALPDPTTANVRKWNDWTAARYKKAATELTAQGLLLEAKRARAGRSHFLPGEWKELKAPWLSLETWKLPLLVEVELDGGSSTPLGGPLVLRPFEELFAAAWQRVCQGDEPRYEEVGKKVKTKASRRK
ncbi:hypothetical protein DTL42_02670 [Bremerella cremea]|uniref:Uncharacterized protein n=1 Tax=Bremerella cremea TaxID=1031537 RepID=A0A368KY34_9BACT|nr:hypothetical protein [Bremerella cremea]RCS54072.1 hypothetical protein DTL42_02670 [Bremerella cremea]